MLPLSSLTHDSLLSLWLLVFFSPAASLNSRDLSSAASTTLPQPIFSGYLVTSLRIHRNYLLSTWVDVPVASLLPYSWLTIRLLNITLKSCKPISSPLGLSSLPVWPLHLRFHSVLEEVHMIPISSVFILAGSCLAPNALTYLPCHLTSDLSFSLSNAMWLCCGLWKEGLSNSFQNSSSVPPQPNFTSP